MQIPVTHFAQRIVDPPRLVGGMAHCAAPTSLWIATVPVLAATCLAWSLAGAFDPATALIALAASVLMQVVTNLQNDVGFTERRTGDGVHVGLPRATANGWLTPREVKQAILATIVIAALATLPVMLRFGWPIVLIGAISTLAAYSYMGGPRPSPTRRSANSPSSSSSDPSPSAAPIICRRERSGPPRGSPARRSERWPRPCCW